MKLAHCAKILGHYVQTFLSTYARFIDAEQATIWATIESRCPRSVRALDVKKVNKINGLNEASDGA